MLYLHYSVAGRNRWAVTSPVRSTKPLAHVTVKPGQQPTFKQLIKRPLTSEELAAIHCFMKMEHQSLSESC